MENEKAVPCGTTLVGWYCLDPRQLRRHCGDDVLEYLRGVLLMMFDPDDHGLQVLEVPTHLDCVRRRTSVLRFRVAQLALEWCARHHFTSQKRLVEGVHGGDVLERAVQGLPVPPGRCLGTAVVFGHHLVDSDIVSVALIPAGQAFVPVFLSDDEAHRDVVRTAHHFGTEPVRTEVLQRSGSKVVPPGGCFKAVFESELCCHLTADCEVHGTILLLEIC